MLRLILLLAAVAFSASCMEEGSPVRKGPSTLDEGGRAVATTAMPTGASAGGTAKEQKAYIDPDAGTLVPHPTTDAAPDDHDTPQSASSVSAKALQEQPSPVAGGGIMIDLQGQFQNPLSATVADDGSTTVAHPAEDRMESTHAAP